MSQSFDWNHYDRYQKQSKLTRDYFRVVNHCKASAIATKIPIGVARGLDIACGHGESTRVLSQFADHIVGVDSSPQLIAEAEKQGLGDRFKFVQSRFEDYETEPGSFDLVGATWYLNHLHTTEELKQAFEKIFNLLTEGGIAAFVVPSAAYPSDEIQSIAREDYAWSMAWTDRRRDRTIGLFSYGDIWIETTVWQPLTLMRMMDPYFEVEAFDVKGLLVGQCRLPHWQTEPPFEVIVGQRRPKEIF